MRCAIRKIQSLYAIYDMRSQMGLALQRRYVHTLDTVPICFIVMGIVMRDCSSGHKRADR